MRTQPEPVALTLESGQQISITWKFHARARHLKLTATHDGFMVTSPPRAPRRLVEQFVQTQRSWIVAQQHKYEATQPQQNRVLYQGDELTMRFEPSGQPRVSVETGSGVLIVRPVSPTPESAQRTLERWLQSEATRLLTPLVHTLSHQMQTQVHQLQFKQTKSRWGSCSMHGSVSLNWRLVHTPPAVMRYVVVHELAHRHHMNHSKEFWHLVEQHDPAYRIHRGWLKRHGHRCITPELKLG